MNEIKKVLASYKPTIPFAEKLKKKNFTKSESDPLLKNRQQQASKTVIEYNIPEAEKNTDVSPQSSPSPSTSPPNEIAPTRSPVLTQPQYSGNVIVVASPFPVTVQYHPVTGQPAVFIHQYVPPVYTSKQVKIS